MLRQEREAAELFAQSILVGGRARPAASPPSGQHAECSPWDQGGSYLRPQGAGGLTGKETLGVAEGVAWSPVWSSVAVSRGGREACRPEPSVTVVPQKVQLSRSHAPPLSEK